MSEEALRNRQLAKLTTSMSTQHIMIQGLRTSYEMHGKGPAILLIHGWAGSRLHWNDAPIFLKSYRIISVDLYGFGDSEESSRVSIPEDYVEPVCEFIKFLEIKRLVLVGHSVGGLVAANVALRIPENTGGLVLIEAPVGRELETVKCPVMLIFGDRNSQMEGLSRVEVAKTQLAHNSAAEVCFIENANHNPMLENPPRFYGVVNDFLGTINNNRNQGNASVDAQTGTATL